MFKKFGKYLVKQIQFLILRPPKYPTSRRGILYTGKVSTQTFLERQTLLHKRSCQFYVFTLIY